MKSQQSEQTANIRDSIRTVLVTGAACGLVLAPAAIALAEDPYMKANDSWVTVSGEVESVSPNRFILDYGKGLITVEMDDGDRDADAYKLLEGDEVTVSGRIDDDFFERRSIEAASIYVENIGTTFFASSVDEEDWGTAVVQVSMPVDVSGASIIGEVTEVYDEEFTLSYGDKAIRVDVDSLGYDPLDDDGYQQIDKGDIVKVTGTFDTEIFTGRELKANTIIELASS